MSTYLSFMSCSNYSYILPSVMSRLLYSSPALHPNSRTILLSPVDTNFDQVSANVYIHIGCPLQSVDSLLIYCWQWTEIRDCCPVSLRPDISPSLHWKYLSILGLVSAFLCWLYQWLVKKLLRITNRTKTNCCSHSIDNSHDKQSNFGKKFIDRNQNLNCPIKQYLHSTKLGYLQATFVLLHTNFQ